MEGPGDLRAQGVLLELVSVQTYILRKAQSGGSKLRHLFLSLFHWNCHKRKGLDQLEEEGSVNSVAATQFQPTAECGNVDPMSRGICFHSFIFFPVSFFNV